MVNVTQFIGITHKAGSVVVLGGLGVPEGLQDGVGLYDLLPKVL